MTSSPSSLPSSSPVTLRLLADHVLLEAAYDRRPELLTNGAVDIGADGRIVAAGPLAVLDAGSTSGGRSRPETVLSLGGLLMPGLINAHAHTPMTLLRSVGDGLPLDRWLSEGVWPREGRMEPEDAFWGMTVGLAEMLTAGVTTSCEMYLFEDEIVDAVARVGSRVVMTPGVIAALLPGGEVEGRIEQIVEFHHSHHDPESGIHVGFAPHSVYDLTPDQCGLIARHARDAGALYHIHLDETEAERQLIIDRYGASATRVLADAGVFEAKVLAAHAVWLDETDRRLLADAGAAVAHCPQSNLKLGSGIAPTVELLNAGIKVGLGTDGPASNDSLDLWQELKLAPLLARGSSRDPLAMSPATALAMATTMAADGLGLDDVGRLRPGAWADIIRIELDHPALTPGIGDDLLSHLVFAGSARFVSDVWVAGRRVVERGRLSSLDVDEALHQVRVRGRRLAQGPG